MFHPTITQVVVYGMLACEADQNNFLKYGQLIQLC